MPMTTPCHGATKPEAGVIVPRPATAPEIMPSTDGLRRVAHSIAPQVNAPAQAARWVAVIAITAREFAPSAVDSDWEITVAGQRVQVIKPAKGKGGTLEFGTTVLTAADGSVRRR